MGSMKTTLPAFIQEVGDAEAARLFGVTVRAAQSWRRGERVPKPDTAARIVRASKGRVSFESCYAARPA